MQKVPKNKYNIQSILRFLYIYIKIIFLIEKLSYSKEKYAELGPTVTIRVHHVEGLRVTAADDSLKPGSHVQQLALRPGSLPPVVHHRDHASSDRHAPDRAEHVPVEVHARARHREAALPPVAVHGPRRLLEQFPPLRLSSHRRDLLGLERDAHEPRRHLLDEGRRGHGELEQQDGLGPGVKLDSEVDVAAAVAEEGAGDLAA